MNKIVSIEWLYENPQQWRNPDSPFRAYDLDGLRPGGQILAITTNPDPDSAQKYIAHVWYERQIYCRQDAHAMLVESPEKG